MFCLSGPPGQRPRNMMSSTNASAFCYLAAMSRNVASACSGSVWKFSECYCTYNLRSLVLARRSADNACSCCLKTNSSFDGSRAFLFDLITLCRTECDISSPQFRNERTFQSCISQLWMSCGVSSSALSTHRMFVLSGISPGSARALNV